MYTLADYKQIKKTATHVLPQETLDIIVKLSKLIGIDQHIQPVFKPEKVYTIPHQITILLNKISEDNYKSIEDKIIKLIDTNPSDIEKISMVIFDIVTANAFYGHIYAGLYISLINKWSLFKELFYLRLSQHMDNLKNIIIIPSSDYDEFCKCNEINERHRTFSQFIVQLTLQGVVDITAFNTFLNQLIDLLYTLKETNKTNMDEIVEHLYLCIMKSKSIHNQLTIQRSRLNMPGVSNKVMFRLMDILDVI